MGDSHPECSQRCLQPRPLALSVERSSGPQSPSTLTGSREPALGLDGERERSAPEAVTPEAGTKLLATEDQLIRNQQSWDFSTSHRMISEGRPRPQ